MKKIFPNTILQALGLVFGSLIIVAPIMLLKQRIDISISQELLMMMFFVIYCLVFIGMTFFLNMKRKFGLKFNFITFSPLLLLVVICFQLGLNVPFGKMFGLFFDNPVKMINPFENKYLLIGSLIFAPFLEEIIFRGIILSGFISTYSPRKAIIFSAILFGFIHLQPNQVVGAVLIGLFLGWIYYKTKSVGVTIILHAVANLTGLFAGWLHFKFGSNTISNISDIYGDYSIYIILVSLALFGYSMKKLIHKVKINELKEAV